MRISVTCTGPIWFQDLSDHGFKFQGDGAGSLFIYYISCIVWRCYTIFILLNGEMDRAIKIDGTAPKWPSCFEVFAHSTAHPVKRLGFVDPAHRLHPLGIWVEILRNDENFKNWKWKPRLSPGPQPSLGPWSFAAEFPASTSVSGHRKFSLLVCMWQSSSVLCFFDHATFFRYNAKK